MIMRILHVVMTFHKNSAAGGSVYNVYAYCKSLIKRGHYVSVCCSDHLDLRKKVKVNRRRIEKNEYIYWEGIRVKYAKSFYLGYGGYGAIISPALAIYLNRAIRNYDVLHIHGIWNTFGIIAGMIGKLHNVPYIVQLHNTFLIRSSRIILKRVFHNLLRSPLLNNAAAILTFTEDEKNEYLRSRPQDDYKTYVIPGIIPTVKIPQKGLFRHKWDIPPEDCLILFLGRLHKDKGIDHLIRSLRFLKLKGLKLAIVGPDAGFVHMLQEIVEDLGLQDHVLFTGPIYGEEKYEVLRDTDIFVLPSLFEQLPVSALEAALCKVTLIISNRCGMTKIVSEMNAGIIVPYGSPPALAKAIEVIRGDPECKKKMGENAKKMVEKHYGNERTIDSLENIYLEASS